MTVQDERPRAVSEEHSINLPMIAALAAVSFDAAVARRTPDIRPVVELARILKGEAQLEESAKKALARLAESPTRDSGQKRSANPDQREDSVWSVATVEKLSKAARDGMATFKEADLAELRDFCIWLSIWARRPRPISPLKLR